MFRIGRGYYKNASINQRNSGMTCTATEIISKLNMSIDRLREIEDQIDKNIIRPFILRIFESQFSTKHEQFRFPKSKKKRIRKKWAKNLRNFRDVPIACMGQDFLVVHPNIRRKLL